MLALVPCTDCNRHVRFDSTACQFCGAELAFAEPAPRRSTRGLTRAMIFAGAALLVPACGGGSEETVQEQESTGAGGGDGQTTGGGDGQTTGGGDGQTTDGQTSDGQDHNITAAPPYGAPPAEDLARIV